MKYGVSGAQTTTLGGLDPVMIAVLPAAPDISGAIYQRQRLYHGRLRLAATVGLVCWLLGKPATTPRFTEADGFQRVPLYG